MKTYSTRSLSILGLLLAFTARTQANDIVDFLRAVNGGSHERHAPPAFQPVGQHHGDARGHHDGFHGSRHGSPELSTRDAYKQNQQFADSHRGFGQYGDHSFGDDRFNQNPYGPDRPGRNQPYADNRIDLRDHNQRHFAPRSSGVRFNVRLSANTGNGQGYGQGYGQPLYIPSQQPQYQTLPPVDNYPPIQSLPPAPGYGYPPVQGYPVAPPLPFEIGEIVDCQVPLATCVRVEDECNIAPNAVPVVVAVRDPHACEHDSGERIVYVQVFVPPCPLRSLNVSPCRTRVSMDFGRYEIDIKSKNDMIIVDYDN